MITIKHKGDLSKTTNFLERIKTLFRASDLDAYGKKGVEALMSATPVDTGLTASSWYYKIDYTKKGVNINFYNSNIQNGVPIAVILQYGHGTGGGGYVRGRDYINPAVQPVFDEMVSDIWKEVTRK